MQKFTQKQLTFIFLLLHFSLNSHFSFKREIYCVLQTAKGCVHWQTALRYQKPSDPACFPQETYLQGINQKIKISDLKIGDEVLVYNQQKGIAYQPVTAWLHRSTKETFVYTSIEYQLQTQENPIQNRILISGMHNIAVLNSQHKKLQFIFTQKLSIGDHLFGLGPYSKSDSPKIVYIRKDNKQKGIYAPYTKSGNYFITGDLNTQQLILVHCFAHVPASYHIAFDIILSAASFLFNLSQQPSDQQNYINPMAKFFQKLFPSVLQLSQMNKKYEKKIKQIHNTEFRTAGDKQVQLDPLRSQREVFLMIDLVISSPSMLP